MARDITTSVRTEEMLDKFISNMAKNDRRPKAALMAIVIEDFAIEHGYLEWLEDQMPDSIIPNKVGK
jgi:hypothetical protein